MKISLIIPAYNEEKYIRECLSSVEKYGKDFFEVIVVNNASTDKTALIAESFPFVRVVYQPQKGLLWARQKGFEESSGDILAYMDSDCIIDSTWFDKISKEFNKNENLVSLSGPYIYYDISKIQKFFVRLFWMILGLTSYFFTGYMIVGGNFAAKKTAIEKISGFNTQEVLFYGEDTDLARRLSPYGKVKFEPNFNIYTSGRRLSEEGVLKSFFIYGLNFLWEVIFKKPLTKSYKDIR
jgi:glycosyltransferase involved in cell wall biosynthesis